MSRRLIALPVIVLMAVGAIIGLATPAGATDQTKSYPLSFSGSVTKHLLDVGPKVCDLCIPDLFFNDPDRSDEEFALGGEIHFDTKLTWQAAATDDIKYNDGLVRQGQTLDVSNTLTEGAGNIHVGLLASGAFGIYERDLTGGQGETPDTLPNFVQTTATVEKSGEVAGTDIPCALPLQGESPRVCEGPEESVDIFSVDVVPTVHITAKLKYKFVVSVDSDGVVSLRRAVVLGGLPVGDGNLAWTGTSPDTIHDGVGITCGQPVGDDLTYALTNNTYDADVDLSAVLTPAVGIELDLFPDPPDLEFGDFPIDLVAFPTLHLTAPDSAPQVLGSILADNVPPVANAGGVGSSHTYTGVEGTAVNFDGTASSDNCGFPTLRWDFSDGGVAFGPQPSHTFTDNGHYTGLLTATDATGNSASQTFEVNVSNAAPIADAGPDGSSAWGRLVAFNGSGTDPGASDQSTLVYKWDFGDGSPSAVGGPNVLHSYSTPDTYHAVLTVTDKDGAPSLSDTRDVVVRKRNTTTSYLGTTSAIFDTASSLSASLVDEFGQTVNSRSVSFSVNGVGKGASNTNSSGIANLAYAPNETSGPYATKAEFGGDSLYESSSSAGSVVISKLATATTYTGATTGGPNKTIVLSAGLKDGNGNALAGRTIAFQLGTQSATAVTNASGVASTSLKLAQKNGTYTVSATYDTTGANAADATKYVGSSQAVTFKLQAK